MSKLCPWKPYVISLSIENELKSLLFYIEAKFSNLQEKLTQLNCSRIERVKPVAQLDLSHLQVWRRRFCENYRPILAI